MLDWLCKRGYGQRIGCVGVGGRIAVLVNFASKPRKTMITYLFIADIP
jgi:hypothetical protein